MANEDGTVAEKGGDDDTPYTLPKDTMDILTEFLKMKGNSDEVEEDWQLSQFWYTEETCQRLVNEAVLALGEGTSVACVSCPSLMDFFLQRKKLEEGKIHLSLFEYDERFRDKYPEHFIYYDYSTPLRVPDDLKESFDILLVDPPFISEECLVKTAQTVRLLSKPSAKIIFCTGSNMEELLYRLLKLRKAAFRPEHQRNLANEFATYTNYDPKSL